MNSKEARFILSAVRPDQATGSDPAVDEALELLKSDPELKAWYDEGCAFDEVVSDKLQEVTPPDDLKASILAGVRVSQAPVRKGRRFFLGAGVAAALAIGLTAWVAVDRAYTPSGESPATAQAFQADMIEAIHGMSGLDYASSDPGAVRSWLTSHGRTIEVDLPGEMVGNTLNGCKILEWKGNQVTLICFDNPDKSKPALHLVIADAAVVEGLSDGGVLSGSAGDWATDVWRSGEHVYFVAARGETQRPRELVPFG